jgi:peptide/nickel transport system substrate-binding protein/oligopeptide transport system substrate-binding protein
VYSAVGRVNQAGQAAAQDAWGATSTKEADALWQKSENSVLADQVLQPLYYQVMYIAHTKCVVPHSAGGDMQIYRTEVTC